MLSLPLSLLLLSLLMICDSLNKNNDDEIICNDFFTVMSSRMPWKNNNYNDDTCKRSLLSLKGRLIVANNQMKLMNSTLTVYNTYDNR